MEMYLIGGRIIHDDALRSLRSMDKLQAIQAMSAEQRAELRERVCGVLKFPLVETRSR